MKLLIREDSSEAADALWAGAASLASSRAVPVEARAALAAAHRARRLSAQTLERAKSELESRLLELDLIELRPPLAREAGELAERYRLGALDAVHLASALALDDPELVVATWDRELRRAAGEAGLDTAPAQG